MNVFSPSDLDMIQQLSVAAGRLNLLKPSVDKLVAHLARLLDADVGSAPVRVLELERRLRELDEIVRRLEHTDRRRRPARKYAELRARMSPEAQRRAAKKAADVRRTLQKSGGKRRS